MIFSFEPQLSEWPTETHVLLEGALTRLILSDFNGNHFFVSDRQEIRWILERFQLPDFMTSHLHRIYQQFSLRGDLVESSRVRCVIVPENLRVTPNEAGSVFKVGINYFLDSRFADSRTKLVVENIVNDTKVHRVALNAARRAARAPSLDFEPVHAGGSTIGLVFEQLIHDGFIVAAIADSEKKCPVSAVGSTARSLNSAFNRVKARGDYIAVASILPCHEMENVLPRKAVALGLNQHQHAMITLIDRIAASGQGKLADDAWAYLDLKNGFSGVDVDGKIKRGLISEDTIRWFSSIFDCSPEDICDQSVPGLGIDLAERFVGQHSAMREFHKYCRSELWLSRFSSFYSFLAWLMAAPERQRVGTIPLQL